MGGYQQNTTKDVWVWTPSQCKKVDPTDRLTVIFWLAFLLLTPPNGEIDGFDFAFLDTRKLDKNERGERSLT